MTTTILSNGSKYGDQPPDGIETLFEVLRDHPLDRTFEPHGNFITANQNGVRFLGNFFAYSHCFEIVTTDSELIERLTEAIRANQQRPDYLSQDDDFDVRTARWRAAQGYPSDFGRGRIH